MTDWSWLKKEYKVLNMGNWEKKDEIDGRKKIAKENWLKLFSVSDNLNFRLF